MIANILANPLIELAPVLRGRMAPGSHLVLAGLLADQVTAVTAAYPDLNFDSTPDGQWVRLVGHCG